MDDIFQLIMGATTPPEIRKIIQRMGASKVRWEDVGGRRNNLATINIGTDPAAGVTERITNAIDAVLEKQWKLEGENDGYGSPRNATESWFNIESGSLASIKNARDKRIETLAKNISVTLKDSGSDQRPTVEIRDHGIGLQSEQFRDSILSLNGSNKIGKLYLMGAYGQGGSTALSYNTYTLIVSKPFFNESKKKTIAFTIVRINEGDLEKDKHEWYEYMVDKSTGFPFTIEVSDEDFAPGTLVRHILMDLDKYKGRITTPSNSLWYLAHNYLFDPIIPFTISDQRGDRNDNRTVTGNNRLLTHTENLEYHNKASLTFKSGKVTIYWWVLNTLGEDPKSRIKHYASVANPIVITFNGQKQGMLGNGLIKNDLKLPFLDRYLIVQIEADQMDNDSKRQLFSSTRESLRDTSILVQLKKLAIDTLDADDKLKQLDHDRKLRYFTKDDTQALDSIKKRLARRINKYLQSSGSGTTVTSSSVGESGNAGEKLPEIPIEDPPTLFEITTKEGFEVHQNKTFSIKFKTDAHPNYFAKAETFVAFIEPQNFGSFTGTARVHRGYGIAYFKVNEDTEINSVGNITLELRPPGVRSMSSNIEVTCVERNESSDGSKKGNNKTPNISIDYVNRESTYYQDNGWDENSVAGVENDQEGVIIFVSEENKNLNQLVARAQRKNDAAVQNIKSKYLEHISFHAFLLDSNKVEGIEDGEEEVSPEVLERIKSVELRNASETVCGMISDFFDVIITESVETEEAVV